MQLVTYTPSDSVESTHVHNAYTNTCTDNQGTSALQRLSLGGFGYIGNVDRGDAIICHRTGHKVSQHLCSIWCVKTQLAQFIQQHIETYTNTHAHTFKSGRHYVVLHCMLNRCSTNKLQNRNILTGYVSSAQTHTMKQKCPHTCDTTTVYLQPRHGS